MINANVKFGKRRLKAGTKDWDWYAWEMDLEDCDLDSLLVLFEG